MNAWIGLGSNVGDRIAWHRRAATTLSQHPGITITAVSRYYESPALLPDNAPAEWNSSFINQVLAVETALSAVQLLAVCQQAEVTLGRRKTGRWGPREIDIDIIAYGNDCVALPELHVPHPEMTKRDFVLLPLREVASDWVYPAGGEYGGKTIAQLCSALLNVTAVAMEG